MRLSAPGGVTDFENDQQRDAWSAHLSQEIDAAIGGIAQCTATSQYVNPSVVDVTTFQRAPIHWPGFPKLLYSQFPTKPEAYAAADAPTVVSGGKIKSGGRRVQDEYLEWFIHRDPQNRIRAIDFTTETLEYWKFLFTADKDLAAKTYSAVLGTAVTVADISTGGNAYNAVNKFNTTVGIVHLIQPNNTLSAELDIAVQSTLPRTDDTGAVTTDVVSCTHCNSPDPAGDSLGEPGRNSDPTIAQMVNAVAATGSQLTIPDPVGLYIQGIDLSGWTGPAGVDVGSCWKVLRGNPAVRARFTVPDAAQLSDFSIGGLPIQYAGQIAERISVFLTAAYGPAGAVQLPPPSPCTGGQATPLAARRPFTRKAATG
ncbi:MAG TPA: hypothetical protein VEI03_04360 [Stellaceae bacterium]|nr:hypothetical protein [Stellaceae bacterium]